MRSYPVKEDHIVTAVNRQTERLPVALLQGYKDIEVSILFFVNFFLFSGKERHYSFSEDANVITTEVKPRLD